MCVIVIDFISFYDFSNGVWNCSDGVVLLLFTQQKQQQTNKQTKKEKKINNSDKMVKVRFFKFILVNIYSTIANVVIYLQI
jgi:hypothetical protein